MGMKSVFEILVQNNRKLWKKTDRSLRSKTPVSNTFPLLCVVLSRSGEIQHKSPMLLLGLLISLQGCRLSR